VPVQKVYGALGDTPGRFAYPRAICADAITNTLWVVDKMGRVQQLRADSGEVVAAWRTPEVQSGKPVGVSIGPGLDRDGDTLLYVPDTHYSRVLIYRPPPPPAPGTPLRNEERPELVATFGSNGNGPGQMIYPTDVGILPTLDGKRVERLYISEYGGNDRVAVYDAGLHFLFSFGSFGVDASPDNIQFDRPQSIEVDLSAAAQKDTGGRGRLVITDSRNHRLGVFTLEGKLVRWMGGPAPRPGDGPPPSDGTRSLFRIPYGLQLLGDGTALVAEFEACRVQRVDLVSGMCLGCWGTPGRGDGELVAPWAVTTIDDRTFIVDSGNNRVMSFRTPRRRSG
jgi:hypothetical protein